VVLGQLATSLIKGSLQALRAIFVHLRQQRKLLLKLLREQRELLVQRALAIVVRSGDLLQTLFNDIAV